MVDKKQQQMKEQIALNLRKKDYYEILGVPKNAEQKQIKDAYRKLALRFHPDKNKVEGAKQVFKKVSNAYSTLTDKQKRQHYDKYGPEQNQPTRQRQYYTNGGQDFDEQDFIFRQFFGGGFNQAFYYSNGRQNRQYAYNQGGRQAQVGGFNIMHVFLLMSLLFMILPKLFETKPYHSMTASVDYNHLQTTRLIKTPYYVREEYFDYIKKNYRNLQEIQLNVDSQYIYKIRNLCQNNLHMKQRLQNTAYANSGDYRAYYLNKAQQIDLSSCKKFNLLRQKFPQYITSLLYY